ncbi:MAG: PASTA domain-containing protein [Oscillospiraceae bacterium]|jgi:stage V sporulation protein D (sporulation-specific penicillin-binding protein)|nr:PASTA domain-containing protein [Oscillospiraceae bacterium]
MAKGTTVRMWRRSTFVLFMLIAVGFGTIVLRLLNLQIFQGKALRQMALDQQLKDTVISAQRGTIYDRNMKPVAQSATVFTVVLEPAYIKTDEKKKLIASGLSEILQLEEDEIIKKASKKSYYVIVKRKIESDVKEKIVNFQKEKKIKGGIRLIEDYKRYYPYGRFASNVIGFTGFDNQGLSGIENFYDKDLMGEFGRIVTARNAVGTDMPFEYEQMIPAKSGHNLVLTIDESIQHSMEKYLEEGRINNRVKNGAVAILMDAEEGDILGLASGGFDLNSPFEIVDLQAKTEIESTKEEDRSKLKGDFLQKQWRNKAVSDTYMPGSTFKIITASMALEEGVVSENSSFNCTGSVIPFEGARRIHCHNRRGHGVQDFQGIISHSCNPGFISLGHALGAENFYKYYKLFGFTQKTGIDLPGEAKGVFFNKDGSMAPMDLTVASFGQNFTITPMQLVTAVGAAVTGKLVEPHVVKHITDENGNILKTKGKSIKRHVVSENTSKNICELLKNNVATGSGRNGSVPGYNIGGKTGTSEKVGNSGPGGKDYIASFCSFFPTDFPKYVLFIMYDTPKGDYYYGGLIAAPVAAKIMSEILPYLGINKRYTEEELEKLDTSTPSLIGLPIEKAKSELIQNQLKFSIKGDGETVVSQIPDAGSGIPKDGTVVIYTNKENSSKKIKVPNFVGLSALNANKLAFSFELNMRVSGVPTQSNEEVVASNQSISPGEFVDPGTVICVEFIQKDDID